MAASHIKPTATAPWTALAKAAAEMRAGGPTIAALFAEDPKRFERFHAVFEGAQGPILLDYSKNRVTDAVLGDLLALARAMGVEDATRHMFAGDKINVTEQRAVLHVALRNRANTPIVVDGHDVMPGVNRVLGQMAQFTHAIRSGAWRGYTGEAITDVVNIGIGGSDLGPVMVCEALKALARPDLRAHFVSNVDGAHLTEVLRLCRPATTLFIVASKTFTTQETLTNAHSAKAWLLNAAHEV